MARAITATSSAASGGSAEVIQTWALKLGAALVLLAAVWFHGYHHGTRRQEAKTQAQIQAAEANARAINAQRFKTLQEAQDAEHLARQAAQRDAAASRAAVVSLRQQAADFAARSLPNDSAASGSCASAEDRSRVLADLLGSAAERADKLAEQADAARIAGQLCERAYEALMVR